MHRGYLLFLILFYSAAGWAVDLERGFDLKAYSVNEGLSQFSASKVVQDHYGFIWIITWDGLNRFDGNGFIKYRHDPFNSNSLSGNRALDILIDDRQQLWVILEKGSVDRYDYTTDCFEHFDFAPLSHVIVTAFYQDSERNYWIGTTNGVYKTHFDGREFIVDDLLLNCPAPGLQNQIACLTENRAGQIWVGTGSGIYVFGKTPRGSSLDGEILNDIAVNSLFGDSDGTLWICSDDGLYYLEGTAFNQGGNHDGDPVRAVEGLGKEPFRAITAVGPGNGVIISTLRPYFLDFQTHAWSPLDIGDSNFFEGNLVTSALTDRTGNVWITSLFKGVGKVDLMQKDDAAEKKAGTEGLFIKSVFRDSRGRVWLGTYFQGLYYYDGDGEVRQMPVQNVGPSYMFVSPSVVEDIYGNVWFSINSSLFVYPAGGQEVVPLNRIYPGDDVPSKPFSLATDRFGRIWAGCSDGLRRIDLSGGNVRVEKVPVGNLSDMVSSEQIFRLLYDPFHNIVWSCTKNDGVYAVFLDEAGEVGHIENIVSRGDMRSLSSNHVWSAGIAPDSTVWFGTDSGLNSCRINGTDISVAAVTGLKALGNLKISSIAIDVTGKLWLGTSAGLYIFDPIPASERVITVNNGLYSNAVLEGMIIYGDRLYAGTINGLNIISLTDDSDAGYPAEVVISDFSIYGRSVKTPVKKRTKLDKPLFDTERITLRYDENNFTIDFISLQYNDFDNNMYMYRLEGYDPDSILTGSHQRSVTYNRLPAGTYRFWVKASNNGNEWTGIKQYLTIKVKAAPWLSAWAFSGYFAAVLLLLYFVYRYIDRKAKYERELSIQEVESKRKDEINALRQRFHSNIAHDIRTPVTLISAPLEDIIGHDSLARNEFVRERAGIINNNVSRLLYLVNQFLEYNEGNKPKPARHNAGKEIGQVVDLFHGLAMSRRIRYEYIQDIDSEELIFDADKLSKILINLISNAFKATPQRGDIFVFAEQQNEHLIIKVQDSGHGISQEELPKIFERLYHNRKIPGQGFGIGLALVKQEVDACNGIIEVRSTIGEGSEFTVKIPCGVSEQEVALSSVRESHEEGGGQDMAGERSGKKIILIVEDDPDLRRYLGDCFSGEHIVVKAADGQAGFDKALQYTPDVILTDLMMPKLDGLSFIRLIRNDHRTSHIPVIVLATKSEHSEINALSAGADDMIQKPFSSKVLKLKVDNYLCRFAGDNRKSAEPETAPAGQVNDREQLFIRSVNEVLLEYLEDPTFSIEFICEKLSISRMQLHRKMVALLNKTTSEYIREFKLDRAKEIIENGERDVETVMMKVGFTSYFHFNKNFKVRFGISVREYAEKDDSVK